MYVDTYTKLALVFACMFPVLYGQGDRKNCRVTEKGTEYRGNSSTTVNGRTCQRWDTTAPHTHTIKPLRHNHCRNPGGEQPGGPWCYTTDPGTRWEYCFVPACKRRTKQCKKACVEENPCLGASCFTYPTARCVPSFCYDCVKIWFDGPIQITCQYEKQPLFSTKCIHTDKGKEYLGTTSVTHSGRECVRWDSQTPHKHNLTGDMLVGKSLSTAENYCRNPDNKEHGPWCFTRDSDVRWEYCFLKHCDMYNTIGDDCLFMFHGVNNFITTPNFHPGRMLNIFIDLEVPGESYIDYFEIYACGTGTIYIDIWEHYYGDHEYTHEDSMEIKIDKIGYNFIECPSYNRRLYSHIDSVIGIHYPDSGQADEATGSGIICYEDSRFPSDDSSPKSRVVEAPIYEHNMVDRLEMEPKEGIKRAVNIKAHLKCAYDYFDSDVDPSVYDDCPGKKWDQHADKCYKFVFKKKTYPDAVGYCRKLSYGAYLLFMDDENDFIYAKANIEFMTKKIGRKLRKRDQWWTCGNRTEGGDWYWNYAVYRPQDLPERLMTYTKWHPGHPTIENGVNKAVALFYQNGAWAFNYENENKRMKFICVYPRPLGYGDYDY